MVSIIIPCYNDDYLKYALQSCVEQDYEDVEVKLVVDHQKLFMPPYVGLEFIQNNENLGTAESINVGLRACSGDYIMILAADDMLTKDSISRRIKMFEEDPELDAIYGFMLKVQGDCSYEEAQKVVPRRHPSEYTVPLYRRRVFQKYGLLHPPMRGREDKEYSYRLGVHSKSPFERRVKIRKADYDVYYYRRHEQAQRKARTRDIYREIGLHMAFDKRMKDLEINGITEKNTEFLK